MGQYQFEQVLVYHQSGHVFPQEDQPDGVWDVFLSGVATEHWPVNSTWLW
jgi:hypothetical protein